MVLGKLPVPGRPTNLDNSGVRAYCDCSRCGRNRSRCGRVYLDKFFLSSITYLSFSLSQGRLGRFYLFVYLFIYLFIYYFCGKIS